MKVNYKKVILSTILWTMTSLILLCALTTMIFVFAFPKTLGNFFNSLGADNLASGLYYRAYESDGDINNCYKALNIQIKRGNDRKIKEYYETFRENSSYFEFLESLKNGYLESKLGLLEKSTMVGEENYLFNKYLASLIKLNEYDKAYNLAVDEFHKYKNFTFEKQGNYAINQFITVSNEIIQMPDEFSGEILTSLKDYFEISTSQFEQNKNVSTENGKAYLIALGNRIILVGQNIVKIDFQNNETAEIINTQLVTINNYIKGLL